MVIFHSYVKVYQRVDSFFGDFPPKKGVWSWIIGSAQLLATHPREMLEICDQRGCEAKRRAGWASDPKNLSQDGEASIG